MTALTALLGRAELLRPAPLRSLAEPRALLRAIERVKARWPDITPRERPDDLERLRAFARRERENDWRGATLADALAAARSAFKPDHLDAPEFAAVRALLIEETRLSGRRALLSTMMSIHLDRWSPDAPHVGPLAAALREARPRLPRRWAATVEALPELLDERHGPQRLAERLAAEADPYEFLREAGLPSPHGPGFLEAASAAYVAALAPALAEPDPEAMRALLRWFRPRGRPAKRVGAAAAVGAMVGPWVRGDPPEDYRSALLDGLLDAFGHPLQGAVWSDVAEAERAVVRRWLVGKTLDAFFEVVTAIDTRWMWDERKAFWQDLHAQGRIVDAWIALPDGSPEARRLWHRITGFGPDEGRADFVRSDARTCLILMKWAAPGAAPKIIVEGSHNHPLYIYREGDEGCPRLGEQVYDRERMKRAIHRDQGRGAARIVHNGAWQQRVLERL